MREAPGAQVKAKLKTLVGLLSCYRFRSFGRLRMTFLVIIEERRQVFLIIDFGQLWVAVGQAQRFRQPVSLRTAKSGAA